MSAIIERTKSVPQHKLHNRRWKSSNKSDASQLFLEFYQSSGHVVLLPERKCQSETDKELKLNHPKSN